MGENYMEEFIHSIVIDTGRPNRTIMGSSGERPFQQSGQLLRALPSRTERSTGMSFSDTSVVPAVVELKYLSAICCMRAILFIINYW